MTPCRWPAPGELGSCLESLSGNSKAAKGVDGLRAKVDDCGSDPSASLPGSCAGEEDVAGCLAARAKCRLCQGFEATWGSDVDCDSIDDGLVEGSCD